jgi:hypothetical protein
VKNNFWYFFLTGFLSVVISMAITRWYIDHPGNQTKNPATCERIGQILDLGENCSPAPSEMNGHYVCRQFGVWQHGMTIGAPRLELVCEKRGPSAPDGGASAR